MKLYMYYITAGDGTALMTGCEEFKNKKQAYKALTAHVSMEGDYFVWLFRVKKNAYKPFHIDSAAGVAPVIEAV